jgi:hypothetical protein
MARSDERKRLERRKMPENREVWIVEFMIQDSRSGRMSRPQIGGAYATEREAREARDKDYGEESFTRLLKLPLGGGGLKRVAA